MTLDAFLEARQATARADEEVLGGNVVSLPSASRVGLPTSVRRMLEVQARLMLPILAGVATAVLVDADPAASIGVLAVWVLVHLNAEGARLRSGVPDLTSMTRHVAVPFAFIGLAVAVGMLPSSVLEGSFVVVAAATGALLLTALVMRSRRRPTRVLVVGDRDHLGRAATSWSKRRDVALVGASLLGDEADGAELDLFDSFGLTTSPGIDDLADRVERVGADMVVVLPSPGIGADDIRRLSWELEDTGATLAVKTDLDSVSTHRLAMSSLADCSIAEIGSSRAPMHVRGLKSAMDRLGGLVLLTLFAPLLLVIVAAVRLESRGPGLFTQIRIGQDGRPFKVYKMRTMCADAEERKQDLGEVDEGNGVLFKVRQDPRITRIGRLLRKTSLDELPQLINVVKGEMSLVGPRPALPDEVAQYDETARRRLAVRPGMTGLWQVSGRSDLDWDTTVALDVRYTDNVTISEDLRICLRTVRAVTSGKGAY
jgi:exopolysaccharide biosynthesis polyprenyl glycosylphosphotransferase